jgi:pimeloyl-ACP methyl ester carboxylesterase
MSTIVIVHGAFGGGWEWREVADIFRGRGHIVFTPTLTGLGERIHLATPDIGLETHIQDIVNLLHYEALDQVTLVGQSYGGMVITAVADQVSERLDQLVYFNALVPQHGQSVRDLSPHAFWQRVTEAMQRAGETWRIPVPPFEDDPEIAAFARGRYTPMPLRAMTDAISLGAQPVSLPRTYVWSTQDQTGLPGIPDLMRPFAERARAQPGWRLEVLEAIPDAYIQQPELVAGVLDAAARRL